MGILKFIGSLLFSAGMYLIGAHYWGYEVVPIYDSVFVTAIFMSFVAFVVSMTGAFVYVGFGLALGMIPAIAASYKGVQQDSVMLILILFVFPILLIGLFFIHPALMTGWIPSKFDWFVPFSYWQYFSMSILSTALSLTIGKTYKDTK